jgi:nitrogen fixation protein FixH
MENNDEIEDEPIEDENQSSLKKPTGKKTFLETLILHNTTIIAVLLAVASLISSHFSQLEKNAYEKSNQIENQKNENEKSLSEANDKIEEYELEETADAAPDKYNKLIIEFNAKVDSLTKQEVIMDKDEKAINGTLARVEEQNKRGALSRTIFEFSILLSSIGKTNKKKWFTFLAIAATLIGLGVILSMMLV